MVLFPDPMARQFDDLAGGQLEIDVMQDLGTIDAIAEVTARILMDPVTEGIVEREAL